MSERARLSMFLVGAAGLAVLLAWGLSGLPSFGAFNGAYALLIDHVVVAQRHATDAVMAVNFDYRALDTLGEEFILFASVVGLAVLLREQRSERECPPGQAGEEHRTERERPPERAGEEHRFQGSSYALRALTLFLVGPLVVSGGFALRGAGRLRQTTRTGYR